METKKCKQCKKSFEPKRKDALYCSNSCKQKAHHNRNESKDFASPNSQEETADFYMDELSLIGWDVPFIHYCFVRRSLAKNATLEQIDKYTTMVYVDYDYFNDNVINTKAFKEFNERFLSNEFKVFPNRFLDGKDTLNP